MTYDIVVQYCASVISYVVQIQQHLSEEGGDCLKTVIACEYKEIGCQAKVNGM